MIEPFAFFEVKLGAGLGHTVEAELCNQFVHRVHLLVACSVPSEQCKEVDHRFGQITALAITGRDRAVFRVVKLQREDRESEPVSVTFGELAVTVRFEQ